MDDLTREQRHYNMSQIKSQKTKPEELVQKYLFHHGFRYRKNDKRYPGHPDIVLPKYKTIIFVNGCFWHMHDCPDFVLPKSNLEYWLPKLQNNKTRDTENITALESDGWRVITIWACELKRKGQREERLKRLIEEIYNEQL
ncbi:MAG: DNA mismatch endonuclease Vsr [Clostridia bacterium]|nr:DNA mismatch endonuclease Vsr [Clostridia bacterium]